MNLYAVVATSETPVFGKGKPPRTHRTLELVEAESPEKAVAQLTSRTNIYTLRYGRTFEVREVGDILECWHAQYDGEPMNPRTELVVSRRLDLEKA